MPHPGILSCPHQCPRLSPSFFFMLTKQRDSRGVGSTRLTAPGRKILGQPRSGCAAFVETIQPITGNQYALIGWSPFAIIFPG